MTVHVDNWALCEDCGFPTVRMPDGKRCARCLGTNLRTLLALERNRSDGGLISLKEASVLIRKGHHNPSWIFSMKTTGKNTFPKPIVVVHGQAMYDLDELWRWVYQFVRRPMIAKGHRRVKAEEINTPPVETRRRKAV